MKNKHFKPPQFIFWILEKLFENDIAESALGEYEENYHYLRTNEGRFKANYWFYVEFINVIADRLMLSTYRSIVMLRNYIIVAFRNMARQKVYSVINILGLSIGIACSVLVFMFVQEEYSYDKFHEKSDRLYRVWSKEYNPERGREISNAETPYMLPDVLRTDYPEVEFSAHYELIPLTVKKNENIFSERVLATEPEFLKMFTFPIISGDKTNPLSQLNSVVLTEEMALKYFNLPDPVGEKLSINLGAQDEEFTVTAILENIPKNSSMNFSFIVPFEKRKLLLNPNLYNSWGNISAESYILVNENTDITSFEEKLQLISENYYEKNMGGAWKSEYFLQPLTGIRHDTEVPAGILPVSNPLYSYILTAIGILVTFIACINFMTLAVGRSLGRAKEVGLRKVLGAVKSQLTKQYLGEAFIITLTAIVTGTLLAVVLLPTFNAFSGKELSFSLNVTTIAALLLLSIIISIAAGGYPAILLSRIQPVSVLKSNSIIQSKGFLGKSLIVIQFTISIFLIITALIIRDQLNFIRETNLGFDREKVVEIASALPANEVNSSFEIFKNEISGSPFVSSVGGAANDFGVQWTRVGFNTSNGEFKSFYQNVIDYDYLKTIDVEFIAGRDFSSEFPSDIRESIIVNEAFLEYFGWDDHIGKQLPWQKFPGHKIIGVVKDFNFSSLHSVIMPLALTLNDPQPIRGGINDITGNYFPLVLRFATVRLNEGNTLEMTNYLQEKWSEVTQNSPFDLTFLDDTINAQYVSEQRWGKIINYTSSFAILIACLGLFGLASLVVEKRMKELGIRKVLGASVPGLLSLVSKNILMLVVAANFFAWPLAYMAMNSWLQGFAFRVDISLYVFIISGLTALFIAAITISYQTIKAATKNPVDTLRYE